MRVFLSCAETDRRWARQLAVHLLKAGIRIVDPFTNSLPGENWYLAAGQALKNADAIVLLLSKALLRSERMKTELDYAYTKPRFRDRCIGVLMRGTKAAAAPWVLRHLGLLEASGTPSEVGRRLTQRLRQPRKAREIRVHATS